MLETVKGLFITGSTGTLGTAFLRRLLAVNREVSVTALIRETSLAGASPRFQEMIRHYSNQIEFIEGDLSDGLSLDQVQKKLEGLDGGVWHFAASINLQGKVDNDEDPVFKVNREGTRRLLRLINRSQTKPRLYYISTAYVSGCQEGCVKETDLSIRQSFRNAYELSKAQSESLVREAFENGLEGCVFRPSIVVNEPEGQSKPQVMDLILDMVAQGANRDEPLVIRCEQTGGLNFVDGDWVAKMMIGLVSHRKHLHKTFHLTNEKNVSLLDLAGEVISRYPQVNVVYDPSKDYQELNAISKALDRVLEEVKTYGCNHPMFDRDNVNSCWEGEIPECLNLGRYVEQRMGPKLTSQLAVKV